VDTVVLMVDGRVAEVGSYVQLMQRDGALAQFLHTALSASEDEADEDPEGLFAFWYCLIPSFLTKDLATSNSIER
jgi:hypothetical protein